MAIATGRDRLPYNDEDAAGGSQPASPRVRLTEESRVKVGCDWPFVNPETVFSRRLALRSSHVRLSHV